jgi:hypothetical protein
MITCSQKEQRMLSLPAACLQLGMTWAQAYNALLSGRLEGEQRGARWFITAESVDRLARAVGSEPTTQRR